MRRRGKTWVIVYDEGRDESGRRIQRWRGGYRTKGEAEDALTKILQSINDHEYARPEKITFAEFVREHYLPHARAVKRATTIEAYERAFNRHVLPVIGGVRLQRLDAARLDRLYRDLQEGDPARERTPLSKSTVRVIAAVISSALAYAKKTKLVVRNVADDSEPPKAEHRQLSVWSAREVGLFLDSVRDDRLYGLWRFLCLTGARRGEGLGLTWLNLDLENGIATIAQQVVPTSAGLVFAPPKTDAGRREIPIDAETVEILREHRERQKLERAVFAEEYVDHDLVFARPDGRPLDPRGISQAFQVRRKTAKLPHVRLHDLRHGIGVMTLDSGLHPELLRRRLGHSKIAVTVDLYMRGRADEAEREVANVLAGRIANGVTK